MAVYPSGVSSNADLYVALDNFGTTLNGAIDASQTTITLTSTTGLPTVGILTIDSEKVKYTGVSGFDITGVTRGFSSTSAATHTDGATVEFNVVEEHHNNLKDEIIAIETELGANSVNVVHIAGTETITGTKTLSSFSGTLAANLAAAGFKLTNLAAGTTSGDSVRYQDVILVNGTNAFSADQPMGGFKLTGLAAGTTNGDSLRYEQVIGVYALDSTAAHLAGTETFTGNKTFSSQIIASSGLQTGSTIVSDTDNTDDLGTTAINFKDLYLKGDILVGSTIAIDLAASAAVAIRGTITNDSAASGFVGEYQESIISTTTNATTTAQYADLTSLSLTAGDWLVTGFINWDSRTGISSTSGNSATGLTSGDNIAASLFASSSTTPLNFPHTITYRVSIASTTTYYLKYRADYSAGTPRAQGSLKARRIR